MPNAIQVIFPYFHQGMWVFDDEDVGLNKEPFVGGADTVIERAIEAKGITNAKEGFRLIFSSGPFPDYDLKLDWLREGDGGNWYRTDKFDLEGWLCPAMFRYFDEAPKALYARFLPRVD
jgi:hypothetical protein|tara:strand:- start:223 stop:579 length:357 start_codon:yes stop_codon:yes gene_type:complete